VGSTFQPAAAAAISMTRAVAGHVVRNIDLAVLTIDSERRH
jgi:hypothetical protein